MTSERFAGEDGWLDRSISRSRHSVEEEGKWKKLEAGESRVTCEGSDLAIYKSDGQDRTVGQLCYKMLDTWRTSPLGAIGLVRHFPCRSWNSKHLRVGCAASSFRAITGCSYYLELCTSRGRIAFKVGDASFSVKLVMGL